MGSRELIEALKAAGEQRIEAVRAEALRAEEDARAAAEEKLGMLRSSYAAREEERRAAQVASARAEAEAEARKILLEAEQELADRLYRIGRAGLESLRKTGYVEAFTAFAAELPRLTWTLVRVNPRDADLARERFPGAQIVADESITGGFTAETAESRIVVTNTFEKRLERVWEELLPGIMREALASHQ